MECHNLKYIAKNDVTVPCGRCPFCMATRRSDWSTRLHYESKLHLEQSFVTLTYANPHLTFKHCKPQLVKRDLQLFFKRLRKAGKKFRYYAVGEYGARTYRPHYHVLFFGLGLNDRRVIETSWPYGQIHQGQVTQASIAYCLKYMVNSKISEMSRDRERTFVLMSRRPGLGSNYLTPSMVKWHHGNGSYTTYRNHVLVDGQKRHLPRYYKSKIFSKLDHVRIAVRDQKAAFKREVEWIRSPSISRMEDPIGYKKLQLQIAAQRIRDKNRKDVKI